MGIRTMTGFTTSSFQVLDRNPCGKHKLHSFLSINKVIGETNWKTIASDFFFLMSV